MKVYWVVFSNTIQRALIYRSRIFTYAFINVFTPILMMVIWTKHYQSGGVVGNYTYSELLSYYVAVTLIGLVTSRVNANVTEDIRDGELSNYVIKPFNYFGFRFFWEVAWHVVKFAVFAVPLLAIIYLGGFRVEFTSEPTLLLIAVFAFLLSYVLSFTLSMLIGSLAFLITETTGITNLYDVLIELFTGKLFPLAFFPILIQQILTVTPFKYLIAFPAEALLGQHDINGLMAGIGMQLLWILAVFTLYHLNWKRGIRKFSAVGL